MNTRYLHRLLFLSLVVCLSICCEAKVRLPALVSDGMVLQRDRELKIRGFSEPDEKITVRFLKKEYQTKANHQGDWMVILPAMKAGGPHSMTINELEIKDILIGDVWLCSGQSNMETPISRVMDLYADEILSYSNDKIRHIKIPLSYNFHGPQNDIRPAEWKPATQKDVMSFTAVPYFFAKYIFEDTNVPVGLINSSVGGSPAEAWISKEGLKEFPHYINDKKICESDTYIEETLRLQNERNRLWNMVLQQEDPGVDGQWYLPSCDDSEWAVTDLFADWGSDGVNPVNGSYWFRKEIDVPEATAKQKAVLRLGCIVNADSVFINGVFTGTTSYQYPPRIYPVPEGVLKKGKNNITIRLISNGGKPHFVKDKPYKLVFDKEEIDLQGEWKYRMGARMMPMPGGVTFQYKPTGLYNAMIAPLQHVALKGVLWYQGESNTGRYNEYYALMSALINDWRTIPEQSELPFLIVQLPNFMEARNDPSESGWAGLREAQLRISQTVPNTGMAVTIDVGEWNDIHPLNKKEVGYRLFLQAKRLVYGDKRVVADGPVFQSAETEGDKVILSFKNGTDDFMPVDELKGFAVAGDNGNFVWANAKIEGHKIIIWNDEIPRPDRVRYAWADNPRDANLKNKTGLPASPFEVKLNK